MAGESRLWSGPSAAACAGWLWMRPEHDGGYRPRRYGTEINGRWYAEAAGALPDGGLRVVLAVARAGGWLERAVIGSLTGMDPAEVDLGVDAAVTAGYIGVDPGGEKSRLWLVGVE